MLLYFSTIAYDMILNQKYHIIYNFFYDTLMQKCIRIIHITCICWKVMYNTIVWFYESNILRVSHYKIQKL